MDPADGRIDPGNHEPPERQHCERIKNQHEGHDLAEEVRTEIRQERPERPQHEQVHDQTEEVETRVAQPLGTPTPRMPQGLAERGDADDDHDARNHTRAALHDPEAGRHQNRYGAGNETEEKARHRQQDRTRVQHHPLAERYRRNHYRQAQKTEAEPRSQLADELGQAFVPPRSRSNEDEKNEN